MLTAEQYTAVATAGIGIPAVLSLCGLIGNGIAACGFAALALFGIARGAEGLTDPDNTAVAYADACSRMLALTALGETASALRRRITRGRVRVVHEEVRLYECIALMMIGALVLAQFAEILQNIIPGGIDSGTFIGIVVAGLTFSMRDIAGCVIAGLFESVRPTFHIGDTITVDAMRATVVDKGMLSIRCTVGDTSVLTMPTSVLAHKPIVVQPAAAADEAPTMTLQAPAGRRPG